MNSRAEATESFPEGSLPKGITVYLKLIAVMQINDGVKEV